MRVSINEDDPGYDTWIESKVSGKVVTVTLDGVLQEFVVTADDQTGEVLRYVTDEEGVIQLTDDRSDAAKQVVKGTVVISIVPKV